MKRKLRLLLFLCIVPWAISAQIVPITGKVTDVKDGAPLAGTTVHTQDLTATITDRDGNYSIMAKPGDVLTISTMGMKKQSVNVGAQSVINVIMEEDLVGLDDIVVIGYGSIKKRDLTGAVGQVKGEDLLNGNPALSINSALQGKLAGVQVRQNDGAPGGGLSITIRGANSFATSTDPLYVVDGVPYGGGSSASSGLSTSGSGSNPLSTINPNDIESIEILKDASATAIYGSRGANGVVLITTKRGKDGKDVVTFSANFSVSQVGKRVEVLDPVTYANYINEQRIRTSIYPDPELPYRGEWYYNYNTNKQIIRDSGKYSPSPEDFRNPGRRYDEYGNVDIVGATDWQDAIFRTGFLHEYNLSVSGGNDKGGYIISGNFAKQTGIIENSDFRRYSLRSNVYRKVMPWLEIGLNMSYSNSLTNFVNTSSASSSLIYSALVFPPVYGSEINDQSENELNWLSANPYIYAREAFDQDRRNNFNTQAYINVKIIDGLSFRQNIGFGYNNGNRYTYYNRLTQQGYTEKGVGGQGDNWSNGLTSESLFSYNKTFAQKHTLNAVAGFTYEQSDWAHKQMSAKNFPSDLTNMWDMSAGLIQNPLRSDRGRSSMISLLGRVNYSYNGKYIATFTYRRDGSSAFVDGNKFANFYSGAIAWRISDEQFVKNLNFFEDLKLRFSVGQTGNASIGSYATLPLMVNANYPVNGTIMPGYAEETWKGPVNKKLKWETTTQYNLGLDVSIVRGRVNFTVDLYSKKTTDLLQRQKIEPNSGFQQMNMNGAWVKNKGLEISGRFIPISKKNFNWSLDANISFNKNEIGGLPGDQFATQLWNNLDYAFLQRNGAPIGAILGFVEDGFYDNLAEVRADPQYRNVAENVAKNMIGEIKYRDINKNSEIDNGDRVIIGDANPDFIYGITNTFTWKNLTFSFFLQGVYGNDILNANLANANVQMAGIGNITRDQYDSRWTEDNMQGAKWPKAVEGGYTREFRFSNRYIENGSYLRLKNVNLGYTFYPKTKHISGINVYVSATNLFTITNYSWYDPDVNATGATRPGVDMYSYPSSRTYSIGVKIDF